MEFQSFKSKVEPEIIEILLLTVEKKNKFYIIFILIRKLIKEKYSNKGELIPSQGLSTN